MEDTGNDNDLNEHSSSTSGGVSDYYNRGFRPVYSIAQRAKQIMKLCREAVQKNNGKKERNKESDLMVVIITHD
jgi:hypothetical protein